MRKEGIRCCFLEVLVILVRIQRAEGGGQGERVLVLGLECRGRGVIVISFHISKVEREELFALYDFSFWSAE